MEGAGVLFLAATVGVALLSVASGQGRQSQPGYRWRGSYCRVRYGDGRDLCNKASSCPPHAPCTEVSQCESISSNQQNYRFYFCRPRVCLVQVNNRILYQDRCDRGSQCGTSSGSSSSCGNSEGITYCTPTLKTYLQFPYEQTLCFMHRERP